MSHSESSSPQTATQAMEFHPSFAMEVRQVAFIVDGQGFKTDATRLAQQSQFIHDMIFNGSVLGGVGEGTVSNPIAVTHCSKETFANFLMWFNHTPWEAVGISALQGNLDVLHLCHMWLITEGFDYAIGQLQNAGLSPAKRLALARKYEIDAWWDSAIRDLLQSSLKMLTLGEHLQCIGLPTLIVIACAKETLAENRRKVSVCLPYPKVLDNAPFCSNPSKCKEVWFTVWIREICRLVHSSITHTPLSEVANVFRNSAFAGMHPECKDFVIDFVSRSVVGLSLEEQIIVDAIREIRAL